MNRFTIHFINGEKLICSANPDNVARFISGEDAFQSQIFQNRDGKPIEVNRDHVLYVEAR